jgi:hypothetical protein
MAPTRSQFTLTPRFLVSNIIAAALLALLAAFLQFVALPHAAWSPFVVLAITPSMLLANLAFIFTRAHA